jgi:hypothetical protein
VPPAHRDARHHGDYFGDIFFFDGIALGFGLLFPFDFGEFELAQKFGFAVAQVGGFFVLLVFDRLVFGFLDLLDLLLQLFDVLGHVDILEVDAGPYFVEHVDGLVGQEAVGDVAIAETSHKL